MVDTTEPVKHQFLSSAPQQVEISIVLEVFKACPFAFKLVTDSSYVVNALKSLECAGPLKSSSPVSSLFDQLQKLIWQRRNPFFCAAHPCTYRSARPIG